MIINIYPANYANGMVGIKLALKSKKIKVKNNARQNIIKKLLNFKAGSMPIMAENTLRNLIKHI